MQTKILLTKKEFTWISQQAQLINGELQDDDIIDITIDDNRIAVGVPNMVRSTQRPVEVNRNEIALGSAMSCEPNDIYNLDEPGKD